MRRITGGEVDAQHGGGTDPLIGSTLRLPRLRPNVNLRAQEIVVAHMYGGGGAASSTAVLSGGDSWKRSSPRLESRSDSVASKSVLKQIDGTATRSARSHDISHMRDSAKSLAPSIPPSLIKETDHVFESSFLPEPGSVYNERDGLWHMKVFPSDTPSSRKDAIQLDAWVTRSMEGYRAASNAAKEDLVTAMETLVPILSVALHEVTRQVTHQCAERGRALEKIWKTFVGLFDRVLVQMQGLLREAKQRSADVALELAGAKEERRSMRRDQPAQCTTKLKKMEEDFYESQLTFKEAFQKEEELNAQLKKDLQQQLRELEEWFPNFTKYQESSIQAYISADSRVATKVRATMTVPQSGTSIMAKVESANGDDPPGEEEEDMPPDLALAEDFRRLLVALNPEKRRAFGQELAPVFLDLSDELTSSRSGRVLQEEVPVAMNAGDTVDAKTKTMFRRLRLEVQEQEETLRSLRRELAALEAGGQIVEGQRTLAGNQEPKGEADEAALGLHGKGTARRSRSERTRRRLPDSDSDLD